MDAGGDIPLVTVDCREALQWFVGNYGIYQGSVRGLFLSDFSEEHEPILESAILNLKSRGLNPLVVTGEMLAKQAEYLWDQSSTKSSLGRPLASKLELDLWSSDLVVVKDLVAPENHKQLWYLYHHLIYPRLLNSRGVVLTSPLSYEEFVRYGAACPDPDFGGKPVNWERLFWLIEASTINLNLFKQVREENLPPMLKAEYYLWMSLKERGLNAVPQHVMGDRMLDLVITDRQRRLNIEIDGVSTIGGYERQNEEANRNRLLVKEGWQILRFTSSEVLNNHTACAETVQQVWESGWRQTSLGRLVTSNDAPDPPQLPEDDDAQCSAIVHGGGPSAITGGAGTGKTTCLIKRVAYLISQGISPEAILVLSHSVETADVIRNALAAEIDKQTVARLNVHPYHDMGFKILKENPGAIKRKGPLKVETNPQKVIERLLTKYKKDLDQLTLEMATELDEFAVAAVISRYKANLISPKDVKSKCKDQVDELIAKVYQAYEDQLQRANRVDPEDRTSLAVQVMLERPEIRARYQHLYEFVLVDEYQDATVVEDLLVRMLSSPQDNLCLVGDTDEAVCEGRGSAPKLLSDISFRMPQTRCYTLEQNWRSHPAIVEHAQALAQGFAGRAAHREVIARREATEEVAVVGPKQLESEQAEAEWIAEEVQLLFDGGRQLRDMAVLYRYHRYGAILEESLSRRGLRCVASHPDAAIVPDEVEDMMCFLKLVVDPDGPKAKEAFDRVCQLRTKEVDPKLSAAIAGFAEANNLSYLKAVEIYSEATADQSCRELQQLVRIIRTMHQEKLPPAETISLLRRTQRLNEYYRAVHIPPGVTYEPLKRLTQLEEDAKKFATIQELIKNRDALKQQLAASGGESGVHVLTLHEAKGLEFPVVFMVGLAEGLFPSENAVDLAEEKRLCYVGLTRAKELLYVTYPGMFNDVTLEPSSFLYEAKLLTPPAPPEPEVIPEPVAPPAAPVQPAAPKKALPSFAQPAQTPARPAHDLPAQTAAPKAPLPSFAQPASVPVKPAVAAPQPVAQPKAPAVPPPVPVPVKPAVAAPQPVAQPKAPAVPPPVPVPVKPAVAAPQPVAQPKAPAVPPPVPVPVKPAAAAPQPVAQPKAPAAPPPVPVPVKPAVAAPQPQVPVVPPRAPVPVPVKPATAPVPPAQPAAPGPVQPVSRPVVAPSIQQPASPPAAAYQPPRPPITQPLPVSPESIPGPQPPAPQPDAPTMPLAAGPHCPNCMGALEAGARFCGGCGYHLATRIPSCPLCASPLEPSAKFCGECGTRVTPTATPQPSFPQSEGMPARGPNQHGWLVKMLKTLE